MATATAILEALPDPNRDENTKVIWRNFQKLGAVTTAAVASGAVIKLPTTSADNVIQPSGAAVKPLTIRGFAAQTAKLLVIENSGTSELFSVSAAGVVAVASSISFSTVTAGAWNGTAIAAPYGGTGQTAYTVGDTLYASSTTALSKLGIGSAGHFLKVASGLPAWSALTSGEVTTALTYTPVNKAGDTMTGLLTLSADPSSALHAATKQYVDAVAQSLQVKTQVACATTGNITLSGEQTIDGVATSGSRVLVKDQSTASQNGIYVSAAGAWTRATDNDAGTEFPGALVFVAGGTANIGDQWYCSNTGTVTVGTTAITWILYYNSVAYVAGAGLTLTGVTFAVGTASASRIVVNADDIDLATFGTAGTFTKFTSDAYGRVSGGTTLVNADIPSTLTGKTYNGLTLTAAAVGFTVAGGTTSKTLTVALDASVSGTNTGDQTITLTGNVTGSGTGSFATTIGTNVVTLAMQAQIATASFMGRNTASTGNQEVLSIATAKTMLGLTGTNSGDQTITLTGDVTGSGTGSFTATIATSSVTLGKLANLPANTIIGNNTGGSAVPLALTVAQTRTMLGLGTADSPTFTSATISGLTAGRVVTTSTGGLLAVDNLYWDATNDRLGVGSGATPPAYTLHVSKAASGALVQASFQNTSNTANSSLEVSLIVGGTSAGDPYHYFQAPGGAEWSAGLDTSAGSYKISNAQGLGSASDRLTLTTGGNLTISGTFAGSNLSGTNTGDQTITLTGDVTGSGTGSFAATIQNDAVTLAKMANMATASILGRNTAGTGDPEVLSATTARTLLGLGTGNTPTFTGATFSGLTANYAVFTNGSKDLVSNDITGTGKVVMSASPTLTGTIIAVTMALSGRINFGGATDDSGTVINAASGTIATASNGGFVSFSVGAPGATNFESLVMKTNAGSGATISVTKGGTGTYRDLILNAGGADRVTVQAATGSVYIPGRLNINGATDTSGSGVNVAGKNISSSGGSAGAHLAFGVGDPSSANNEFIFLAHTGTTGIISVDKTGTGSFRSLQFNTSSAAALTIDTSQNATFSGSITGAKSFAAGITLTSASSLTLSATHHTVIYTGGATCTMTLPLASGCPGRVYILICRGNPPSLIALARSGSDTVNGNVPSTTQSGMHILVSDGVNNWQGYTTVMTTF